MAKKLPAAYPVQPIIEIAGGLFTDQVMYYRGTSLIRSYPTLRPYSRPTPRALWWF